MTLLNRRVPSIPLGWAACAASAFVGAYFGPASVTVGIWSAAAVLAYAIGVTRAHAAGRALAHYRDDCDFHEWAANTRLTVTRHDGSFYTAPLTELRELDHLLFTEPSSVAVLDCSWLKDEGEAPTHGHPC